MMAEVCFDKTSLWAYFGAIGVLTLFQPGRGVESTPRGFSLAIALNVNKSTSNFLTFKFHYRDIIGQKIKFIACQGVT